MLLKELVDVTVCKGKSMSQNASVDFRDFTVPGEVTFELRNVFYSKVSAKVFAIRANHFGGMLRCKVFSELSL